MGKSISSHFTVLDQVRGIAALTVFAAHYVQIYYQTDKMGALGVMSKLLGVWGVSIFFILSGFLIHFGTLSEFANNKRVSWKKYVIRRFFRIYPPYFICLVVCYVIGFYVQTNMISKGDLPNFLTHIFMISTFFTNYFETINAIFWTVIVEVHFYIFYPVIWWLLQKMSIWYVFLLSFIVGLAYFLAVSKFIEPGLEKIMYQLTSINLFWKWMLGVVLAEIYWKRNTIFVINKMRAIILSYCLLVLAFVPEIFISNKFALQYERFVVPFINFILLGILIFSVLKNFENNILKWVGKVSFSLYLWHPIALLITVRVFEKGGLFSFICAITISLIFAWISYIFTEKKSINIGKNIITQL
jgi:peptidoglycan/LPS O-acetylase OafA/YrhL